jgi:hypothetical protein
VDVAALFATLDAVKSQKEIAKFQFRASNTWVSGTHSRSQLSDVYGAMQEMRHKNVTTLDADHPAVLVGQDHGPHRSSTCCTPLLPASRPALPTLRPRVGSSMRQPG